MKDKDKCKETIDMFADEINYIVTIQDGRGRREIKCDTEEQAWKAVGSRDFGGLYSVGSPTGKSVGGFIPF